MIGLCSAKQLRVMRRESIHMYLEVILGTSVFYRITELYKTILFFQYLRVFHWHSILDVPLNLYSSTDNKIVHKRLLQTN